MWIAQRMTMQVCARKLLQQHIYVYIYLLYIYKNWFHLSDLIITFWLYCVVNIQVSSRELLHWTRCLASKQTHTLTHTHTHAHTHTHTHTHWTNTHTLSLACTRGRARGSRCPQTCLLIFNYVCPNVTWAHFPGSVHCWCRLVLRCWFLLSIRQAPSLWFVSLPLMQIFLFKRIFLELFLSISVCPTRHRIIQYIFIFIWGWILLWNWSHSLWQFLGF